MVEALFKFFLKTLPIVIPFILFVCYFVQQAVTVEIAERKGYNKTKAALMSLIPIFGLLYYLKAESRKKLVKGSLRRSVTPKELLAKFVVYAQLFFMSLIVLIPVIYIVGASFADTDSLPLTILPKDFTFDNYENLFTGTKFKTWYKNTLSIALVNMFGGIVFITFAAYVFARFKFKGKRVGLITIIVLQGFPSFLGLVAMFTLFETFGLLGRPLALSILYIGGSIPGNIWIIKGFLQNIPKELDESAMIDGANKLQIFFKIIMPLSVPILSFVAVSQFMAPWMDYILPRLLLSVRVGENAEIQDQWTLAVGLFDLIDGVSDNQYTTFAAGAMIVAVPITILYMLFQKYLVEGITAGATKG